MRGEAGFTLYEMMIGVIVGSVVIGIGAGLAATVRREDRAASAYEQDLRELERAVVAVEEDLRAASAAEDLEYRLDGDRLFRGERIVARRIAAFDVEAEGTLAHVRLRLASRNAVPNRSEISFTVRMRGGVR